MWNIDKCGLLRLFACCFLILAMVRTDAFALPDGFVYLDDVSPGILFDIRYSGNNNFIGRPVDGYLSSKCVVTNQVGEALEKVRSELSQFGLGLKVFDGYRPQRAVDNFVRWANDPNDTKMKEEYYPRVRKDSLFEQGYIAEKSGHSSGGSVDLTIVVLKGKNKEAELDMGTGFDFFDPTSWTESSAVSGAQSAHRLLLKTLMEKHGFIGYEKEWWHFTLKNEPFPKRYFDFPIE